MTPSPTCPGASPLAGPDPIGPSVICMPLANDRAAEAQNRDREDDRAVIFTRGKDPATYLGACCGAYTMCRVWRSEKARIEAERHRGALTFETLNADPDTPARSAIPRDFEELTGRPAPGVRP